MKSEVILIQYDISCTINFNFVPMTTKKGIAILGSTGSIGTQALDVIEAHPESFDLRVLTANFNGDLLIEQAKKFKPNAVVIADESKYKLVDCS
jgi:1-deoxy-D-xylulose-5-phosphate reductoisomerase